MLKRNKKKLILAAVLSAAFCVGGYGISDAYTYNGVTSTISQVNEDENEFVVTGKSTITTSNTLNPQKKKTVTTTTTQTVPATIIYYREQIGLHDDAIHLAGFQVVNLPNGCTQQQADELISILTGQISGVTTTLLNNYNSKYGTQVEIQDLGYAESNCFSASNVKELQLKYNNGTWSTYEWNDPTEVGSYSSGGGYHSSGTTTLNKTVSTTKNLGDASITVSGASTLTSNADVRTSKDINVSNTSVLAAVKGTVSGNNITTDGQIRAVTAKSAGVGIFANNIIAKGILKATGSGIYAYGGSISANTIESAGTFIANDFIKSGGKVKGKGIKVSKINASNVSIGGAVSFTTGTTFAGGVTVNNNKVVSVNTGTESTDLINLGQLNNAFANAGKTYIAGGNIAINSTNNAISIVKNGAVKSDDTGIVTGATVFDITSGLESSLTLQNTRLTNLSSSIQSKETSFGTINTSVSGLQSNVNSAVSSLNTKTQSYLRNDFRNISDEGKTRLSNLITSSIKNYKDSLNGVVSASAENTDVGASIVTLDNKGIPTVSALDSDASNTVNVGTIEAGNTSAVTGGDIYTALDTKANKDTVNSMLNEKVSAFEFSSVKDSVNQNKEDIAGLKDSKADVSSFNTALEGKVDKADFDTLNSQTMVNREDITSLISSKLNADGSGQDASAYSTKLANGILEKQNKGLVTGGMVYDALRFTADKDYVDAIDEGLSHTLQETASSLNKDMHKMAAGAAALAGLHPQDYNENSKVDFATGYGHYKDANAVAVGLFYHPNPIATVSLSGTMGNGSPLVNAGLSFKIGYGKHVEKAVVNKADYEALQEQVNQLKQMIQNI